MCDFDFESELTVNYENIIILRLNVQISDKLKVSIN